MAAAKTTARKGTTAARRRKTALDKPFPLCYLKKQQLRCCFYAHPGTLCPGA